MKKRRFVPVDGVSNIELFYDLIFVYCISVITSLCHHIEGGFIEPSTWLVYIFSFLVVLQVWFYTTLLLNRYGDRSASDNICLFINMFLLYFLASGIQVNWEDSFFTFNLAWALILANLLVHWAIKRFHYDNFDDVDKRIMNGTIIVLGVQLIVVLVAAFLPTDSGKIVSWIGLLIGTLVWSQISSFHKKPARFSHVTERCSLLVIVAFGETIVAVAIYFGGTTQILYPILVFAMVVGLFLIYVYENDNMIDHHKTTDGMFYMTITGWVILVIGNLAVSLEFMPMAEVAFVPKSMMLMACLVLYLLTSFLLGRYNKPQFHYSAGYVIGRIATCAFIVIVAFVTSFDPLITLICDTAAIYFALWHEWLLYHGRLNLIEFGCSLGIAKDEADEAGFTFETREGRRAIREAVAELREQAESNEIR